MAVASAYQPPKYLPQSDDDWYHVLYGHVPGYQLDFILRPQLPFQKLKLQHFSDLQLVIRHLRPPPHYPVAFALCNLSAHDTQHRPGHGALAIVAAVRLPQTSDHAGRVSPVFSHAAVLVDQPVIAAGLSAAACQFMRRFRRLGPEWYKTYYDQNHPLDGRAPSEYVQRFADLPAITSDAAQVRWRARGSRLTPLRPVIRCAERQSLDSVLDAAARIAAILYHSQVRWLSIGNGDPTAAEQIQATGGEPELTVRFVYGSPPEACSGDEPLQSLPIDQLPTDEQDLAAFLGLIPVVRSPALSLCQTPAPECRVGATKVAPQPGAAAVHCLPPNLVGKAAQRPGGQLAGSSAQGPTWPGCAVLPAAGLAAPAGGRKRRLGVPILIVGTVAAVLLGTWLVGSDRPTATLAVRSIPHAGNPESQPPVAPGQAPATRGRTDGAGPKAGPQPAAQRSPRAAAKPAPKAAAKPQTKASPEPKFQGKLAPKPSPKPSPRTVATSAPPDPEQALQQARQGIARCEKLCEGEECQERVNSVRANIIDLAKANKPQLATPEVRRLCQYCAAGLPDYCK